MIAQDFQLFIKRFLAGLGQCAFKLKTGRLQVLVIDDWFPDPSIGAGAPRAARLLCALVSAGADVTHFSTSEPPNVDPAIRRSVPRITCRMQHERQDYSLAKFLDESYGRFAVILISRPHNMSAFKVARLHVATPARQAVVIYDAEAIFSEREIRQKAISGRALSPAVGKALIDSEIDLAKGVDVVLAVNEHNASLFRSAGHADVRVVRHAVSGRFDRTPHAERETILFVGPTYSDETPNTDSVVWFVDNVLPLMREKRESPFRLTVVGRSAAPAIAAMPRDSIDLRGMIRNLTDEYAHALVFVAPTRFAAGIPLKVYEAAAHGVPCVITSLLAEQLDWQDEKEALVADTPDLFARQCLRLMQDEVLWERLRIAAYRRTLHECDWSNFKTTVESLLPAASERSMF